jgi:laccase
LPNVFTKDFPKQPPYNFNFTGNVGNNTIYPSLGTKALIVKYKDSVEIVFQGTNVGAAENHPMHLHGYSFYVVGTGSGNFNKKTDPKSYNLKDPPLVNTVGVPKNGWVTIRFIANNPGMFLNDVKLYFKRKKKKKKHDLSTTLSTTTQNRHR